MLEHENTDAMFVVRKCMRNMRIKEIN